MAEIEVGIPGTAYVGPKGDKGDKGDPLRVDETGTLAERVAYNTAPANFAYFATDVGLLYFKASATSGDWTAGIPFGKGDKGDPGDQGDPGEKGDRGDPGEQGEQGLQGETGERGLKGDVGSGLNIVGSVPLESDLPASGEEGDGYLIDGDLYVWDGDSWENVGQIQGPPGEQGEDGPQGDPGVAGKTVRNGTGGPSSGLGQDGDFYIDTQNFRIFGPKSGTWGSYTALTGPAGADGKTIRSGTGAPPAGLGVDGDFYLDTANSRLYGPKASGAWPGSYTSLVGSQGLQGNPGSDATVPDATETVKGKVELATSAEVQTGTDTVRAITPAGLSARSATDSRSGVVELATASEVQGGTDTGRAITPATLKGEVDRRDGVVESWIAPTLQNAWANQGGAFATVAYRKDRQGRVWLRGTVVGGTSGTLVFTLPAGYRPTASHRFICMPSAVTTTANVCVIASDGTVTINFSGSNPLTSLDNVVFWTT